MKKVIALAGLIIAIKTQAQVHVGITGTSRGGNFHTGYLLTLPSQVEVDFQAGIKGSRRADNPWVYNLSVGLPLYLTDRLILTPASGAAYYSVKDLTEEPTEPYKIQDDKGIAPYGQIELGFEQIKFDGNRAVMRLFISAQYCKNFYAGVGIKGFFR